MAHCNQCEHDWTPRVDTPASCPLCKRYDWSEPKKGSLLTPPKVSPYVDGKGTPARRPDHKACPACNGLNGLHAKGCKL